MTSAPTADPKAKEAVTLADKSSAGRPCTRKECVPSRDGYNRT